MDNLSNVLVKLKKIYNKSNKQKRLIKTTIKVVKIIILSYNLITNFRYKH